MGDLPVLIFQVMNWPSCIYATWWGGRLPQPHKSDGAAQELLYRFEFPEKPGALMAFVEELNPNWNISIFHYRNQVSDVGRIVVGVQVPPHELSHWQQFLDQLKVPCTNETDNPAYQLFLV